MELLVQDRLPQPRTRESIPKVYFFGDAEGRFVKIGYTTGPLSSRRSSLETGQFSKVKLVLLAAIRASRTHEASIKKHFEHLLDGSNSTETFRPDNELVEYINWLRQQWWTLMDEAQETEHIPNLNDWFPNATRRVGFDPDDPTTLVQRNRAYSGPTAGTKWDHLCHPVQQTGEDFYTPVEIVEAARKAMGGADLDAASHWLANRVHRFPLYYHDNRNAFDNPWHGRVWLNPPYGNNEPWFNQIKKYWDTGDITQLCMVSPVWAFATKQARVTLQGRSSAMVLLAPTPVFWGHPKGSTGTNHPHAVVYFGPRVQEFKEAFSPFGMPFQLL